MSRCLVLCALATWLFSPPSGAQPAPQTIRIPSEKPAGDPIVDRIWFTLYRSPREPAPAVIIVHSLAEGRRSLLHRGLHRMARYFAGRGITAAVIELPYHMRRLPRGVSNLRLFTGSSLAAADAYDQSAADVSTVAEWLRRAPGVQAERVGVVGLSLGAIIAHLAMGRDARLSAGVAILGGGDLDRLRRDSLLARLLHPRPPSLTPELQEALRKVDPLTFAGANRPRRVLMIQAARDLIVPPGASAKLWEALGRPPIRWVDANHFGLLLGAPSVAKAAADYLLQVWSGVEPGSERIPPVGAATLKLGLISGLDSLLTPAVQWQALRLGTRPDHMSLFHLDLGLSGRGPFAGIAVTVNPSLDVGVARRLNGRGLRPYASLHLVF